MSVLNERPIVMICGPTASGKSALAKRLCARLPCEIVSADSVQVYREFDIGTSKPHPDEQDAVKHHLVDILEPRQNFSAHDFQLRADEAIRDIQSRSHIPLIVGGSSLYVQALVQGLFDAPKADEEIRSRHKAIIKGEGLDALYQRLQTIDPISCERIHANDAVRISRALEVFEQTGVPISEHRKAHQFKQQRYHAMIFSICLPRESLRDRIRNRVDEMISMGLVEEVQALLAKGYGGTQPMRSLGYRQIQAHLTGETDLLFAISKIKKLTWRFAKRQIRQLSAFESSMGLKSLHCQSSKDIDIDAIVEAITNNECKVPICDLSTLGV